MTTANAVKKLAKAGFEVTTNGRFIAAKKGSRVIDMSTNGGDLVGTVATIKVRSVLDRDQVEIDYSAGVYCDNVSQAIKLASN